MAQVFVLDGGLPAWERGGFVLDTDKPCAHSPLVHVSLELHTRLFHAHPAWSTQRKIGPKSRKTATARGATDTSPCSGVCKTCTTGLKPTGSQLVFGTGFRFSFWSRAPVVFPSALSRCRCWTRGQLDDSTALRRSPGRGCGAAIFLVRVHWGVAPKCSQPALSHGAHIPRQGLGACHSVNCFSRTEPSAHRYCRSSSPVSQHRTQAKHGTDRPSCGRYLHAWGSRA